MKRSRNNRGRAILFNKNHSVAIGRVLQVKAGADDFDGIVKRFSVQVDCQSFLGNGCVPQEYLFTELFLQGGDHRRQFGIIESQGGGAVVDCPDLSLALRRFFM
jgi:hypothetical protein